MVSGVLAVGWSIKALLALVNMRQATSGSKPVKKDRLDRRSEQTRPGGKKTLKRGGKQLFLNVSLEKEQPHICVLIVPLLTQKVDPAESPL